MKISHLRWALFKSHSKKNPNIKHEKPCFELLVRTVQETPKIIQAVIIILRCIPDMEGKFHVLQIQGIEASGHQLLHIEAYCSITINRCSLPI